MRTLHKSLIAVAMAAVLVVPLLDFDGASATAPEKEQAPPAIVGVANAVTTQLAPVHWAPGSVISRRDAKVASDQDGHACARAMFCCAASWA
jgi:hypothetical protein